MKKTSCEWCPMHSDFLCEPTDCMSREIEALRKRIAELQDALNKAQQDAQQDD